MRKLVLHPDYQLYEQNGIPFCDSIQVAEIFRKTHKNVLRAIRDAIETLDQASNKYNCANITSEFNRLNFEPIDYKDVKGRKQPKFLLTKAGFNYIATAFTGEEASIYKVMLLSRFEQMEKFIKSMQAARLEHPAFTRAIADAHGEPRHYHFSNEADMINRIVIGKSAKKFREEHDLPKGTSIRPYLSDRQIKAIEELQRIDVGLLVVEPDFNARKRILTNHYSTKIILRLSA